MMNDDALETTIHAAAATIIASSSSSSVDHPYPQSHHQKRRWGGFWSLYWCFRSNKHNKRIGHAVLLPDPSTTQNREASIEGAHFIKTGKLLNLSEQQLVDCDHTCDIKEKDACDDGCGGGLMTNAYKYLIEAGGLQEESSYPYTGMRGECKFDPNKVVVKVENFTNIPIEENQIAANLVIVSFDPWMQHSRVVWWFWQVIIELLDVLIWL